MPRDLVQLDVRRPATRILAILLLILATTWAYFALRWYLGNTLAEYFNTAESSIDMARLAASLAPNDPLTHWRLGQVYQKKLPLDQQGQVIAEYQKAVNLSPNDYRFWMALGTAYEQSGDHVNGEHALRQAVALAPSYSYPHWYLGNLLLREARYDEAFAELRIASEADTDLRPQLFNLVLQIFGADIQGIRRGVGETPGIKGEFSVYLMGQKRFEDGLVVWNSLSESEKKENQDTGKLVVTTLINAQRFHDALSVWNSVAPNQALRAEIGQFVDGGFEEPITQGSETVFGWQLSPAPQVQIGIDPSKAHSGSRSLRMLFQVRTKLDSINASELVPVASSTQYDFECYLKTEKLQSGSTPIIQITDATDGAALAASEGAPNGDNDWSRIGLSFKTGPKTEAIRLKFVRDACGEDQICPIFGVVWYDDFAIKRRD